VNKTLYEKTLASGFGSVYFLLDASEQQQVIFIAEQAKHICNLWVCFVRERISLTVGVLCSIKKHSWHMLCCSAETSIRYCMLFTWYLDL
jgi:hypothetical protein